MAETTYVLEDGTRVRFEIDAGDGFRPAVGDKTVGRLEDAADSAVRGALAVFERVRAAGPSAMEMRFGIKVTGTMSWLVARAATDASFEVTLKWDLPREGEAGGGLGR